MTIYKQILIFFICLFSGLLLIAYAVQFQSTRDYLAEQQRITVINTANSVGLALTPYLEASDTVGAESVINAAFDGGFYNNIHLNLLATKEQIDKSNEISVQGVPAWFTNLNLFKNEQYSTILTSGCVITSYSIHYTKLYEEGILNYYKDKEAYLQGQLGNPEGVDSPNKKYYDPRVWLRKAQESMSYNFV